MAAVVAVAVAVAVKELVVVVAEAYTFACTSFRPLGYTDQS